MHFNELIETWTDLGFQNTGYDVKVELRGKTTVISIHPRYDDQSHAQLQIDPLGIIVDSMINSKFVGKPEYEKIIKLIFQALVNWANKNNRVLAMIPEKDAHKAFKTALEYHRFVLDKEGIYTRMPYANSLTTVNQKVT